MVIIMSNEVISNEVKRCKTFDLVKGKYGSIQYSRPRINWDENAVVVEL